MTQKGQGLIEAIIALSAGVLVISALAIVVISAVGNSDYTRIQNQATAYAQEQLESLKDKAKTDWGSFNAMDGIYCINVQGNLYSSTSDCRTVDAGGIYVRQVDITHSSSSLAACGYDPPGPTLPTGTLIEVTVSWNDGRCQSANDFCHEVKLNSCSERINVIPTP